MKILGIEDVLNGRMIDNVELTKDNKLLFFDFGANLLDNELHRKFQISLTDIHHNVTLGKSLQETRERYLQGYNTENDENGLAKTIHPHIKKIVMTRGPGDEEFRKDMAKIIQTRINNAFILA